MMDEMKIQLGATEGSVKGKEFPITDMAIKTIEDLRILEGNIFKEAQDSINDITLRRDKRLKEVRRDAKTLLRGFLEVD